MTVLAALVDGSGKALVDGFGNVSVVSVISGNAFQQNAFQQSPAAFQEPSTAGQTVLQRGPPVGTLSRKDFREAMERIEAKQAAIEALAQQERSRAEALAARKLAALERGRIEDEQRTEYRNRLARLVTQAEIIAGRIKPSDGIDQSRWLMAQAKFSDVLSAAHKAGLVRFYANLPPPPKPPPTEEDLMGLPTWRGEDNMDLPEWAADEDDGWLN